MMKRGLLGSDPVNQYTQNWATIDSAQVPMGQAEQPTSYLHGGDKFGWKEGLALALAGIGDAFAAENGQDTGAMRGMMARAMSAREAARKAQAASAEKERLIALGMQAGLTAPQSELVSADLANFSDFKAPEAPSFIREAAAFNALSPEQQAQVTKFMDINNPRFTNGPNGTMFIPRTTVPDNAQPLTEEEIRQLGLNPGGPTQRASGGFRY